ncbi:SEC-C domain-containing protein [Metabacillus sp. KIGAM252]|uniref:SEC-C domain-containing protein n=2 Tax=Metabacillus flavus TaxID=2823519 RepID=A0ABS5LA51_9BACI|nr:SEC-C domain-containing protein [Metabacillus flavus]
MEQGYDNGLLEFERDLYATCIISGVDHPKLQTWKSIIEKREAKTTRGRIVFTPPAPSAPTNNITRNAPCPSGSGKKYKKCCGK